MAKIWQLHKNNLEKLPLFPLPNVVFFPQTLLPLHIFELRYRIMIQHALESERLIGMALLRPSWEQCAVYENCHTGPRLGDGIPSLFTSPAKFSPAIMSMICVGRIVKHEPLPDGRSNILLMGLSRARIHEELLSEHPYRIARADIVQDNYCETDAVQLIEIRNLVSTQCSRFCQSQNEYNESVRRILESTLPLGVLIDALSATLPFDIYAKQQILEQQDVLSRTFRFLRMLEDLLARFKHQSSLHTPAQWLDFTRIALN